MNKSMKMVIVDDVEVVVELPRNDKLVEDDEVDAVLPHEDNLVDEVDAVLPHDDILVFEVDAELLHDDIGMYGEVVSWVLPCEGSDKMEDMEVKMIKKKEVDASVLHRTSKEIMEEKIIEREI